MLHDLGRGLHLFCCVFIFLKIGWEFSRGGVGASCTTTSSPSFSTSSTISGADGSFLAALQCISSATSFTFCTVPHSDAVSIFNNSLTFPSISHSWSSHAASSCASHRGMSFSFMAFTSSTVTHSNATCSSTNLLLPPRDLAACVLVLSLCILPLHILYHFNSTSQ